MVSAPDVKAAGSPPASSRVMTPLRWLAFALSQFALFWAVSRSFEKPRGLSTLDFVLLGAWQVSLIGWLVQKLREDRRRLTAARG